MFLQMRAACLILSARNVKRVWCVGSEPRPCHFTAIVHLFVIWPCDCLFVCPGRCWGRLRRVIIRAARSALPDRPVSNQSIRVITAQLRSLTPANHTQINSSKLQGLPDRGSGSSHQLDQNNHSRRDHFGLKNCDLMGFWSSLTVVQLTRPDYCPWNLCQNIWQVFCQCLLPCISFDCYCFAIVSGGLCSLHETISSWVDGDAPSFGVVAACNGGSTGVFFCICIFFLYFVLVFCISPQYIW